MTNAEKVAADPHHDLVRQYAINNPTTAGFIAACYHDLNNVMECLDLRGWDKGLIAKFAADCVKNYEMLNQSEVYGD